MKSYYYVVNCIIQFNRQGDEPLKGVKYKISLFNSSNQIIEQFEDITNTKGQTKPLIFDQNGTLKIFVEGYKTHLSTEKKWMEPLLSKDSHIIEIDESKLDQNVKFLTEKQYEIQKKNAQEIVANMKKTLEKSIYNGVPNIFNVPTNKGGSSIFSKQIEMKAPPVFRMSMEKNGFLKDAEENLAYFEKDYKTYKEKNTKKIPKLFFRYFKTYSIYQFVDSRNKGIPNVRYQIFDKKIEKALVNNKPIACNEKGLTEIAWTPSGTPYPKHYVRYFIGNIEIFSDFFKPLTCVDIPVINKIKLNTTLGVTTLDKNNTLSLGSLKKPPIIIDPHNNEVLILKPELYAEFDKKTKLLADAIGNVHKTNKELTRAIQARNLDEIKEMEKRLNINQEKAIEKINEDFQQHADIKEVWIVESQAQKTGNPKHNLARRYLNVSTYAQYKKNKLNQESQAQITNGNNPNGVEQPRQIESNFEKLSKKLLTAKGSIGSEEKAVYDLIGGLGGEIAEEYETSKGINVKQEAQWMRMVAGANGEGMISASSKGVKMNLEGNASVKWTLFEGSKEWRKFFPSEDGWYLSYKEYDLGEIRFLIGAEVSGFSGANLGISGNLSIDITHQGTKQVITGVARDPQRSMTQMMRRVKDKNNPFIAADQGSLELIAKNKEGGKNQANAEVKAFAGVQVQGVLKGAIEWFDPGINGESEAKFVTIASASAGGGVSAGVGAEGQFQIGYSETSKTFRILVAAHLCWGVGAKGTAAFDVGAEQMLNYAGFIKSQIGYAGFKTLAFINEQSFLRLSQVLAVCIGEDHQITQGALILSRAYGLWIKNLDVDQGRLNTAKKVNSNRGRRELMYATPETKGILLYAVSHWTDKTAGIFDSRITFNSIIDIDVTFFPERKTAIINILSCCTSAAEWRNTIQHIHPKGSKLNDSQLGKVEGDLIRFLNYDKFEDQVENKKRTETIIYCINHDQEYGGNDLNEWLKKYFQYRKGASEIKDHLNYLIVRNQDDFKFQQMKNEQGLLGGFGESTLTASNLKILAPFDDDQNNMDQEYKV